MNYPKVVFIDASDSAKLGSGDAKSSGIRRCMAPTPIWTDQSCFYRCVASAHMITTDFNPLPGEAANYYKNRRFGQYHIAFGLTLPLHDHTGFWYWLSLPHISKNKHSSTPAFMKIIPLSEGSFTIDKTKVFVPFSAGEHDLQQRPAGSLLVEVQPFAVITEHDVLVIDCGLGFSIEGQLQIHKNLRANGIEPSSVTKVLMSHLHKDHAGGVSVKDSSGNFSLSFTNATYYVQQQELDYAFEVGFPSYITDELSVLKDNPSVKLLKGSGIVDDYIYYEVSGGHSPYHQVFRIEDDGHIAFFGGDVAPQLQQMKSRLVAKYDYDGKKSMELRQLWWQLGQQQEWKFMFYHDIKNPVWPIE